MPLITLHNLQGAPKVVDTADIELYFASRFGPYTRVNFKHAVMDVQEAPNVIERRIKDAIAAEQGKT